MPHAEFSIDGNITLCTLTGENESVMLQSMMRDSQGICWAGLTFDMTEEEQQLAMHGALLECALRKLGGSFDLQSFVIQGIVSASNSAAAALLRAGDLEKAAVLLDQVEPVVCKEGKEGGIGHEPSRLRLQAVTLNNRSCLYFRQGEPTHHVVVHVVTI